MLGDPIKKGMEPTQQGMRNHLVNVICFSSNNRNILKQN